MKHKHKPYTVTVAVASAALIAIGLTAASAAASSIPKANPFADEPSGPPVRGGTFTLATAEDIPTLDPAFAGYDVGSWSMTISIFSALVDYGTGLTLEGDLAKSWSLSPDQKTYTFHLRSGVEFSDGTPMTASDFTFSIDRVVNPKTASPGAYLFSDIVGAAQYAAGKSAAISGIETPDATTIIVNLMKPQPYFPNILAMPYARVMSPAQVAKWGSSISQHPLGTGPFELQSWASGGNMVLVRNPHYFLPGRPYLNKVILEQDVPDETQVLEYQRGELSAVDIPPSGFAQLALNSTYNKTMDVNYDATTYYLGMKDNIKPFNNLKVREALNYAVDKTRLVQLLNGRGTVANGLVPPTLPGFNPNAKGYPYDPAKAKALLAEAGYPHGFSTTIWTENDDQSVEIAQSIAADLAAVGVNAKVDALNASTFVAGEGKQGQAPMFISYWLQDFPDAYDFFSNLLLKQNWGGSNPFYYYNPTIEAAIEKLEFSDTDRSQEIESLDAQVTAQAPFVYLYHSITEYVHQPNVFFYIHPVHLWRFADYWIK
jgi:peptide/nickel transport system substrate-binding protein/oligopeptide transport system substrate-binding protein